MKKRIVIIGLVTGILVIIFLFYFNSEKYRFSKEELIRAYEDSDSPKEISRYIYQRVYDKQENHGPRAYPDRFIHFCADNWSYAEEVASDYINEHEKNITIKRKEDKYFYEFKLINSSIWPNEEYSIDYIYRVYKCSFVEDYQYRIDKITICDYRDDDTSCKSKEVPIRNEYSGKFNTKPTEELIKTLLGTGIDYTLSDIGDSYIYTKYHIWYTDHDVLPITKIVLFKSAYKINKDSGEIYIIKKEELRTVNYWRE